MKYSVPYGEKALSIISQRNLKVKSSIPKMKLDFDEIIKAVIHSKHKLTRFENFLMKLDHIKQIIKALSSTTNFVSLFCL